MDKRSDAYSNLRVEEVAGFCYIEHTVISTDPESDAISRMYKAAEEKGIENSFLLIFFLSWNKMIVLEKANYYG